MSVRSLGTVLLALALASSAAFAEEAAWSHVSAAREGLTAASPLRVDFVQSFTPNGFSTPDEESGVMAMRLLDGDQAGECLRWDYTEPLPKSFLLCDRIAWTWNADDGTGRRDVLGQADQVGLDLLRLSLDQLRHSYSAAVLSEGSDRVEVRLESTADAAQAEIRDAVFELDRASGRLVALSYHDVEGNLTRFALGVYRPLEDPQRTFSPPEGLAWLED